MTCWETIAESLHEIRSGGPFSEDAIAILKNELARLESEQLKQAIEEITSRENFGDPESIEAVFELFAKLDKFAREITKIVAARLLNKRDA